MAQVLLDTHILIWWQFDSARLSRAQLQTLLDVEKRGQPRFLSAISLREIANLTATGRLEIPVSPDIWLEEIESDLTVLRLPQGSPPKASGWARVSPKIRRTRSLPPRRDAMA